MIGHAELLRLQGNSDIDSAVIGLALDHSLFIDFCCNKSLKAVIWQLTEKCASYQFG